MIAACIDRWALTSPNAKIRSFCRPHIARRVIIGLIPLWTLIPVHLAIFINNESGRCGPPVSYAFVFGIYLVIFIGILPPVMMIFFGVLARHNLLLIRTRVATSIQPTRARLHKADRDLMKMLTGEVVVYIITTLLYPANILYGVVTTSMLEKNAMRVAVESLISFIISPVLNFIFCVASFYGMIEV